MTTNEERIRGLEDENEGLRSQLQDWKEKAAELEMAPPPPEVEVTFKTTREEAIAVHVAEVIAKIQGEMRKKENEDLRASRERYLEDTERRTDLLEKVAAALETALDVEKEHSLAYELWRIRKAVETLTGQSYSD